MGRRGRRKRKYQEQGGFAAFDQKAKEHERRRREKIKADHKKVPAPFESIVLPEPIDIPEWKDGN